MLTYFENSFTDKYPVEMFIKAFFFSLFVMEMIFFYFPQTGNLLLQVKYKKLNRKKRILHVDLEPLLSNKFDTVVDIVAFPLISLLV